MTKRSAPLDTAWDASRLRAVFERSGKTEEQVVAELQALISRVNAGRDEGTPELPTVKAWTLRRWLTGRNEPRWRHAYLLARTLESDVESVLPKDLSDT